MSDHEIEDFKYKSVPYNTSGLGRVPKRGSEEAAGYDIYASEECTIPARGSAGVGSGLYIAIPKGFYGRVSSRSGLSFKKDIEVGAGIIDSDYRGELRIKLYNHGDKPFDILAGDRIAQIIFHKYEAVVFFHTDYLNETNRSVGGFGSTGIN